jgi:hypothetical protein
MANSLLTKWLKAMTVDSNGNDAIKLHGVTTDQNTKAKSWETAFRSAITSDDKLRNISK